MINEIERCVAEYILKNYTSAVEVGFGGKTTAAEFLVERGVSVLCTDVHSYDSAVPCVVDDCFEPDLSLYKGADVIYSIRPGCEIVPPMIELARKVGCDLIVYHLGFELFEDGGEKIDADGVILHKYV
ncbi:MAG: UPF0146 family protein [Methanocorpusculum sp.]|nr:UPF0146 family protein [Methanocorpusculum sp.]